MTKYSVSHIIKIRADVKICVRLYVTVLFGATSLGFSEHVKYLLYYYDMIMFRRLHVFHMWIM